MIPTLSEEGFETSKVIALIDVLLQEGDTASTSTITGAGYSHTFPSRKKLVKRIKTCYQLSIPDSQSHISQNLHLFLIRFV
ncbi:hypothetical protein Pst134EA_032577 [Puccinia striiformis f. sp. tritici]|uniref:uncharacterized protein n=1 Tax=Puccinia striiformis f. sp. tritici TaxID=168172 RepID=UPI0020084C75|nr:uncharacterized protein Pst134EA_032577 [Puccinia striiformis f. sp. tritici]KAH9443586.1 hypothetical protein Pst134EA_032577 [Puccinia striiformis f. sp. tritici]